MRYRILLAILLCLPVNMLTAQEEPASCRVSAVRTAFAAQMRTVDSIEDVLNAALALQTQAMACIFETELVPREGVWQWQYEEGDNWIRTCPDGAQIAYPQDQLRVIQSGSTFETSTGGQFQRIEPGVYLLTQPYQAGTATVITERWDVIDEERIAAQSWEYFPESDCTFQTTFEMIFIEELPADV